MRRDGLQIFISCIHFVINSFHWLLAFSILSPNNAGKKLVWTIFVQQFFPKVKIPQFKSEWQYRLEKVRDYCKNHDLIIHEPPELSDENISQIERDPIQTDYEDWLTFNIVHITGLALNWCMVPKVASSSVSELILPYLKKLNMKFPFPQLEVWTRAGRLSYADFAQQLQARQPSFLITRHPFARIVSAFKNKIENRTKFRDGNEFYNNWSRQIIKCVRCNNWVRHKC